MGPISTYTPAQLIGELNQVEHKNAPTELFTVGDVQLLAKGRRVAVVGSRDASSMGLARATKLARLLVERDVVVVSGLAAGVDTAAHTAAIAAGGRTVAVLGTPLDKFFPVANRALQETIMRDHLVVSQFPVGSASRRQCFPMRNRTMALLSDATVIVEAGDKSGTIYQRWEALRLGRPLFILESTVKDKSLSWPAKLLGHGAEVLSSRHSELLFERLPDSAQNKLGHLAL